MKFYHPTNREKKIAKKFCLFPFRANNITYWLETIYVKVIYREYPRSWYFYGMSTKEEYEKYLEQKRENNK